MANYKQILVLSQVVILTVIAVRYIAVENALQNKPTAITRQYQGHNITQRLGTITDQYNFHNITQRVGTIADQHGVHNIRQRLGTTTEQYQVYNMTQVLATIMGQYEVHKTTQRSSYVSTHRSVPKMAEESTCSDRATVRGLHQKVVSFSYYGPPSNPREYFKGIEGNARILPDYYKNWTMRVYHNVPLTNSDLTKSLEELQKKFSYLDFCDIARLPHGVNISGSQENIWRFLPMTDPLVDVFVSRDLDGRFSNRELAAVNEWLKSNLTFHIMRDHPYHGPPYKILAGMWGAVVRNNRSLLNNTWEKILDRGRKAGKKTMDQLILADIVWSLVNGTTTMQHDSYHCKTYHNTKPWPVRRNNTVFNFVGARTTVDTKPLTAKCPMKCRPEQHQDWETC